jgi:hypothetical protein
VGKIWTENPYNVRAFKQTITQAWRLKNSIEVQDLEKTCFFFVSQQKRMLTMCCEMALGVLIEIS